MCSLTFWPWNRGYLLGMNRDEQRTRVHGLAPVSRLRGGRTVVHPSEPGGGTWISLNDLGVSLALLNAYSIPESGPPASVSRGAIIRSLSDLSCARQLPGALRNLPLARIAPFRLFGCFPGTETLVEWRWDRSKLDRIDHPWAPGFWASSGYREAEAQRLRRATFEHRCKEPDAGTREWFRRLHASHDPEPGPFSICMHRPDATTVSYTEVRFEGTFFEMHHQRGSPCQGCRIEGVGHSPASNVPPAGRALPDTQPSITAEVESAVS